LLENALFVTKKQLFKLQKKIRMKEFIILYKELFWIAGVLLFTLLMLFISANVLNLIERKWKQSSRYAPVFRSLRRISKVFLTLLGIGLISYLFVDESFYPTLNNNISRVIWFGLVLTITVVLAAASKAYFLNKMDSITHRDAGDITLYKYLGYLVLALIYSIAIFLIALSVPALSNIATAAGASAGAIAIIAGVASQEGIANLVGGLFIAFFKPFRIGDIVKIGASPMGRVEDINLRHTVIKDFQNIRIIIPNAIVNKENISNYDMIETKNCEWIEVGISYSSDMDTAISVLRDICENHPFCMDLRTEKDKEKGVPKVDVQVVGLGNSSINLKAWVWSASYLRGFEMRNQIYKSIKEGFDAAGIEIPFPHTTVVLKKE
jgi:small-conductance mechanosensitive channel